MVFKLICLLIIFLSFFESNATSHYDSLGMMINNGEKEKISEFIEKDLSSGDYLDFDKWIKCADAFYISNHHYSAMVFYKFADDKLNFLLDFLESDQVNYDYKSIRKKLDKKINKLYLLYGFNRDLLYFDYDDEVELSTDQFFDYLSNTISVPNDSLTQYLPIPYPKNAYEVKLEAYIDQFRTDDDSALENEESSGEDQEYEEEEYPDEEEEYPDEEEEYPDEEEEYPDEEEEYPDEEEEYPDEEEEYPDEEEEYPDEEEEYPDEVEEDYPDEDPDDEDVQDEDVSDMEPVKSTPKKEKNSSKSMKSKRQQKIKFPEPEDITDVDKLVEYDVLELERNTEIPPDWIESGKKAEVTVSVLITKQGKPLKCLIVKSSSKKLNTPALKAILKTKFKPAEKDGVPADSWIKIHINF